MTKAPQSIQDLASQILEAAKLPPEEQLESPLVKQILKSMDGYAHKGSKLLTSYSEDPEKDAIMIMENPFFTILTATMNQVFGFATAFIDPQDAFEFACVIIGALMDSGIVTINQPAQDVDDGWEVNPDGTSNQKVD